MWASHRGQLSVLPKDQADIRSDQGSGVIGVSVRAFIDFVKARKNSLCNAAVENKVRPSQQVADMASDIQSTPCSK